MKKKVDKYEINKGTVVTMIILVTISFLVLILLSYYINLENTLPIEEIDRNKLVVFQTLREVCVALASICGFNLLASAIIEVKSKNKYISEIIVEDVISAPEFYSNLPIAEKKEIYGALERALYFNSEKAQEIFNGIREKLSKEVDQYYFEECNYVVSCKICDTCIEKTVTKKIKIRSYKNEYKIENFCVGNYVGKSIDGMISYELKELSVNGNVLDLAKDIRYEDLKMNNLDKQNKYDSGKTIIYNGALLVTNDCDTIVEIKSVSRTKLDDRISTFRVIKPCRKFSLIYSLETHDNYRISVDAFGFLDDADESTNNEATDNVNIIFNDWIFKYDGVVVTILDK